jgi:hypothetical protein
LSRWAPRTSRPRSRGKAGISFGTKKERQAFTAVDVPEVERADVGKGRWWPDRPSYDRGLSFRSGFRLFMIENPLAVSLLRQVFEALRRVGIETVDRHDVFWAGGNDPHYRPA